MLGCLDVVRIEQGVEVGEGGVKDADCQLGLIRELLGYFGGCGRSGGWFWEALLGGCVGDDFLVAGHGFRAGMQERCHIEVCG